ncbi:MAG TPA: phosphatase PAP2 family protein [Bacteroidales bacterium]|nr:phosphatase PAP2 family protein [Bacteroidales bacterium]
MVTFDQQLFLWLNAIHSPFFDRVMTVISYPPTWIPLYLALIVVLVRQLGRKMYIMILTIALMITVSDQGSVIIKNIVRRPRPCYENALDGKVHIVNGKCGGRFGFLSSHAANSFAVALLSLLLIRKKWFTVSIITWAIIVGYSRIYLGVHYPGDVFCGSLFGALAGWAAYLLFDTIDRNYLQKSLYFNPVSKEP